MRTSILEVAEDLFELDPVQGYPQRGAELVARVAGATSFRLRLAEDGREVFSDPKPPWDAIHMTLPLRNGRQVVGEIDLYTAEGASPWAEQIEQTRWAAGLFARGLGYLQRLGSDQSRRMGENVEAALARAPLTPRERHVVSLLVSGASTRDIADRSQLTVATVNTYLKRIFSKLGVHSRVELVARMAGTEGMPAISSTPRARTQAAASPMAESSPS